MTDPTKIDDELKTRLEKADAVIVSYDIVHKVTDYIDEDTTLFATCDQMGYHIIEQGRIATQVGMSAVDHDDDIVSLWMEPGYGIVTAGNEPSKEELLAVDLPSENPAEREVNGTGTIRPVEDDLCRKTLSALAAVMDGYEDMNPDTPPEDLDPYRQGRHEALQDVKGVMSRWAYLIAEDIQRPRSRVSLVKEFCDQ
jgi:hypothetical protein